jgi:hypothetical protein
MEELIRMAKQMKYNAEMYKLNQKILDRKIDYPEFKRLKEKLQYKYEDYID